MCASTNLSKLLPCVTAPQRVQEQHPSPVYAKCTCVSVALHALSFVWYFPSLCSLPFFCFGQAGPKTKRLAPLQPVLANQLIGFCGGSGSFDPPNHPHIPPPGLSALCIIASLVGPVLTAPVGQLQHWAKVACSGVPNPLRADELG